MRELRDIGGRMPYRLWYGEVEIDMIMEDELHRCGTARIGEAAVEVDAFIEIYLGITPEYVDLPPGVQGATDFARDGSVRMRSRPRVHLGPAQVSHIACPSLRSPAVAPATATVLSVQLCSRSATRAGGSLFRVVSWATIGGSITRR